MRGARPTRACTRRPVPTEEKKAGMLREELTLDTKVGQVDSTITHQGKYFWVVNKFPWCLMAYALWPMPYGLCPMAYALWPMPYGLCLMA